MNALSKEHEDVIFICVNTRSTGDAKAYKDSKGLDSDKLLQGANRPPNVYGLKYIPHKVVIGKDGKVIKNFEGVNLRDDVPAAKAA